MTTIHKDGNSKGKHAVHYREKGVITNHIYEGVSKVLFIQTLMINTASTVFTVFFQLFASIGVAMHSKRTPQIQSCYMSTSCNTHICLTDVGVYRRNYLRDHDDARSLNCCPGVNRGIHSRCHLLNLRLYTWACFSRTSTISRRLKGFLEIRRHKQVPRMSYLRKKTLSQLLSFSCPSSGY